jgi:hypothetical protein
MKNGITDLRNHLFETLERLKDPDPKSPMDTETAESVCLVAKRLIETAQVEIEFRRLTGQTAVGSEFLELPSEPKKLAKAS